MEIEIEKTFLIKEFPKNLKKCKSTEIIDIYIPQRAVHPVLRIRKSDDFYAITKKAPLKKKDSSEQIEQTIILSKEQFKAFSALKGKKLRKIRYYYPFGGLTAEIDFYLDKLKGLATVDFEFKKSSEKNKFKMPYFCLADITQKEFCAGGILAGKKYSDIEPFLKKYNYKKIIKV